MTPEVARKIINNNQQIYNEIAHDFSKTRQGKLQELEPLTQLVKNNDRVLDVGSGSGRLFEVFGNRDIEFYGIDSGAEMIKICQEKFKALPRVHFEVADLLSTRFPNNYFNAIYAVATLHHIPSRLLRIKALQEFHRMLKPGGKLIMTNWYYWSLPAILIIFKFYLSKLLALILPTKILTWLLSWSFIHLPIRANKKMVADLDLGDIFVPWGKVGLRYYHSFRKQELKKLLSRAGFVKITQYLARKRGDHWGKRVNLVTIAEKSL